MSNDRNFHIYRQLADLEEQRGAQQMRDRFLILAADAALTAGLHGDADALRARLLESNPHHLLRPYHSFTEAMRSADVYSYIADLRGSYPPADAEQLLASLGGKVPEEAHRPADPPHSTKPSVPDDPPHYEIEKPDPIPAPEEPAVLPLPPRTEAKKARKVTLESVAALAPIPEMPEQAPTYRQPEPAPRPARRRPEPEEPSLLSVWVATALFVVVLVAGVAFATYTLARPFLAH